MIDDSTWRELIGEALRESDPVMLKPKVDAAQAAIVERLRELRNQETHERELLHQGLRTLRRLQVERLNYPLAPGLGR